MIKNEKLFNIILSIHVSEKSTLLMKTYNVLVFKVRKNAKKKEIKQAVSCLFGIKISSVNTLILQGKKKIYKKTVGFKDDWKKAYVVVKKGQNINFIKDIVK